MSARYAGLGDALPRTECLKDVLVRLLPYWESDIKEDLKAGKTVLVTAHGNSLRAIIMEVEKLTPDQIMKVEIATCRPIYYDIAATGEVVDKKVSVPA